MGILLLEQALNGLQLGLMLFLLAAGLTLVFGIMDMVNLAHGSLYMVGAYLIATVSVAADSFWVGLGAGVLATAVLGMLLEVTILRRLYRRWFERALLQRACLRRPKLCWWLWCRQP